MSAWRRVAIAKIPRLRSLIERAENIWRLWTELFTEFAVAHSDPIDEELIDQIHSYALWCIDSPDVQTYNAAVLCFYEDLPIHPEVRQHMAAWMSEDEFRRADEVFRYHLKSDDAFDEFVRDFYQQKERLGCRPPSTGDEKSQQW
jgi:hypothetical protein